MCMFLCMKLNEIMRSRNTQVLKYIGPDQREFKETEMCQAARQLPASNLHTGLGYAIRQSGNVDKTLEEHEGLVGGVEEMN